MKRKVLLLIISSFMLMGVVSAASLWGTYKGNQIIRLTVDGVPVKVSDAPAVSMDGRTMIPIYLLKEAGIKYSWDNKNQTVNVFSQRNNNTTIPNTGTNSDADKVRAYVAAADFYKRLDALGISLTGLSNHLSLVYNGVRMNDDYKPDYDYLDEVINIYNSFTEEIDDINSTVSYYGINISSAYDILNNYFKGIDFYKASFSGISKYLVSQSNKDFNVYLNNSSDGFNIVSDGRSKGIEEYKYFISLALDY